MSRRTIDEAADESLQVLRETGHDDLADDLAYALRKRLSRPQWVVAHLKTVLMYSLITGALVVTTIGFVQTAMQAEYLSALLILAFGCLILVAIALVDVVLDSFREYLLTEGLGSDRTSRTRGRV